MATTTEILIALHIGMTRAVPSVACYAAMRRLNDDGASLPVIAAIQGDDLFQAVYPPELSNQAFAGSLVDYLLGAEVGAAQTEWATNWLAGRLEAGTSRTDAVLQAVTALLDTDNSGYAQAKAALGNKLYVARYYLFVNEQHFDNISSLRSIIAGVTSDPYTVLQALDGFFYPDMGGPIAQTFTLTAGADSPVGTAGSDDFIGILDDVDTLNALDVLDGGQGDDELRIFDLAGDKPLLPAGLTLSSIEILTLASVAAINLDLAVFPGFTSVVVQQSGGPVTLNVSANPGLTTIDGSSMTGSLTVTAAPDSSTNILGGAGVDVIAAVSGNNYLSGGAGDDTLAAGTGQSYLHGGEGADTFVVVPSTEFRKHATITDFSTGDSLQLVDHGAESFDPEPLSVEGAPVLRELADAAVNAGGDASTDGQVAWFQFQGNTYVVQSLHNATSTPGFKEGEDVIIRLTGLVDLSKLAFSSGEISILQWI